jgi:hypothetical protein
MHNGIKRYDSVGTMKADEYEAWRHLPPSERIRAVSELTMAVYGLTRQTMFQDFKELLSVLNARRVR